MMSGTPRLDEVEDQFGLEARRAAEHFSAELYVLVFQENRRGGDPVAHTPDGKTVFPDKYRGGEDMQIGEAWLCDVQSKGGSTFFAAPIQKIDASFFLDLLPTQKDLIVRLALQRHTDIMAPYIAQVIEANKEDLAQGRLGELEAEKEQLESRLHDLEEQYDDAAHRLRRYEAEVRTLREQSLDSAGSADAEPTRATAPHAFAPVATYSNEGGPVRVVRAHEDVLESPAFEAERYFGHISPDRRRVFLKAHHNGNLSCIDGRVQIPGLGRIVPYDPERQELAGSYDPRHGGFFVKLA